MLISRFRKCSDQPDEVKTKLFKALSAMLMAVTYGVDLLWHNNIYRKLVGVRRDASISAIYVNNSIDPFGVLLRKIIFSFRTRSFI